MTGNVYIADRLLDRTPDAVAWCPDKAIEPLDRTDRLTGETDALTRGSKLAVITPATGDDAALPLFHLTGAAINDWRWQPERTDAGI